MPGKLKNKKTRRPAWTQPIVDLRRKLRFNQSELGRRLHYSAMAISRWERGEQEPTDRGYIELGNLAGDPLCWYFWERAGLNNENLLGVAPMLRQRVENARFQNLEIVTAGTGGRKQAGGKMQLVAIPLLGIVAASHGEQGGNPSSILSGPVQSMIAAPKDWCPNPASTRCLQVRGKSMTPLIPDGCIVAVDSSQTNHDLLNGKIVVAWHKNKGLAVSRFRRFDHTEILEPANDGYESISLSAKNRWKILARVLWWIGKAP